MEDKTVRAKQLLALQLSRIKLVGQAEAPDLVGRSDKSRRAYHLRLKLPKPHNHKVLLIMPLVFMWPFMMRIKEKQTWEPSVSDCLYESLSTQVSVLWCCAALPLFSRCSVLFLAVNIDFCSQLTYGRGCQRQQLKIPLCLTQYSNKSMSKIDFVSFATRHCQARNRLWQNLWEIVKLLNNDDDNCWATIDKHGLCFI